MENKRRFQRFPFQEPVEYQRGYVPVRGSLGGNISLGGIKLVMQEFIAIGTVLEMMVHFDHPLRKVLVKGKVMWVKECPGGERYEVGIEFIQEDQPQAEIRQYLSTRRFDPI